MKSYNEQYAAYVDALEERLKLECKRRLLPGSAVGEACLLYTSGRLSTAWGGSWDTAFPPGRR